MKARAASVSRILGQHFTRFNAPGATEGFSVWGNGPDACVVAYSGPAAKMDERLGQYADRLCRHLEVERRPGRLIVCSRPAGPGRRGVSHGWLPVL